MVAPRSKDIGRRCPVITRGNTATLDQVVAWSETLEPLRTK
ncbi:hypothetical protein [Micromonospora sp. DPT]